MPGATVVTEDGVRLAVREWPGNAPAVLLLHGLASSSHIWDLVAPRLAAAGHRAVAYDQRGHGLSAKPTRGYGFDRVAADAASVIASRKLQRPVVVGHSWGASVALELAVRRPRRVSGAVLIDGGFLSMRERMDWATARQMLAPPELKGQRLEEFLAGLRGYLADTLPLTPEIEAAFLSLMRVDREGRIHPRLSRANHFRILRALWEERTQEVLTRVRVPTLVLAVRSLPGAPDSAGFMEEKERAARQVRAIGGPVRLEWIRGIHDIPLLRPGAVAGRIARFAAEVVG